MRCVLNLVSRGILQTHVERCLIVQCPIVQCPIAQCPIAQCPIAQCPIAQCPIVQSACPIVTCPIVQCPIVQYPIVPCPILRVQTFSVQSLRVQKSVTPEGSDVILKYNCVALMFDEIRYKLDSVEIDRNRNVGITTTLKHYVTVSSDRNVIMRNAGWDVLAHANGHFNFCVLLHMLLGFCEDYRRVVINARYELILIRSRNDNNCLFGDSTLEPVINIFKIQWRMPHVLLSEIKKLLMLRALESGRYLSMGFCSCDLYEFPLLQRTTKHSPLRPRLSWRNHDTFSLLCRQAGKISCLRIRVDSTTAN